ncbi:hypothetical protein D3C81_644700 [compost metagenome]
MSEQAARMSERQGDYELAFNEVHQGWIELGAGPAFAKLCDAVEHRLQAKYPADREEITEMMATWLVTVGASSPDDLQGFV